MKTKRKIKIKLPNGSDSDFVTLTVPLIKLIINAPRISAFSTDHGTDEDFTIRIF